MQYIDLISGALAHHTNLPIERVKEHFNKNLEKSDRNADLLRLIMAIDFPQTEGNILLDDLKSRKLIDTIDFMFQSLQMIKYETARQALLN